MQDMAKAGASSRFVAMEKISARGVFWVAVVVWAAAMLYAAHIWRFDLRLALLVILVVVVIGAVVTRRNNLGTDGGRSRTSLLVGLIFIAGAACGVFDYLERGRHWHDLLVIPLPLMVGMYLIYRSLRPLAAPKALDEASD